MKIVSVAPLYTEHGNGLYSTKKDGLLLVAKVATDSKDWGKQDTIIRFDLMADRDGFSFKPMEQGAFYEDVCKAFVNKTALNVAKKALAGCDKSDNAVCFAHVNGYVNFDKLATKP